MKEKIIVSFTSFPKRIQYVHKVLDCIIRQTVMPDKILLYLSSRQFEDYIEFPNFSSYEEYGFEIRWNEEDLGPHKKYYYAMQEYPDDIIITIDDDIYYKDTMIETLLLFHKKIPQAVIGRRAHQITCTEDGLIAPYDEWYSGCKRYIGIPRMDLIVTGCGGILYPPNCFDKEVFNKEVFMKLCKSADDLWLKVMELYSGIPVVLAEKTFEDAIVEECMESALFLGDNAHGGNDIQLHNLVLRYNDYHGQNDKLTERLFANGRMNANEVIHVEEEDKELVISELKKLALNHDIIVYGAGVVANQIACLYESENLLDKIKAFVVQDTSKNVGHIKGIPVRKYTEYLNMSEMVVIGLGHEKQEEVYNILLADGMEKERIIRLSAWDNFVIASRVDWNGSKRYWEDRYQKGGNSGAGSYNHLAQFKADQINKFVKENSIQTVMEWGCGDGNQLALAEYPQYIGYDVSQKAIEICKQKFENDCKKHFFWCGSEEFRNNNLVDLALSLDVIYHLVEDDVFETYMERLFSSSKKYVCIYSCNFEKKYALHVRCRKFTEYVEKKLPEWSLVKFVANAYPYDEAKPNDTSWSDFYFYKKLI